MNIDWKLLREQKTTLIYLGVKNTLTDHEKLAVNGIIHLIDGLQDEAVNSGTATEEEVFGSEE
jgi:hypothetical protein